MEMKITNVTPNSCRVSDGAGTSTVLTYEGPIVLAVSEGEERILDKHTPFVVRAKFVVSDGVPSASPDPVVRYVYGSETSVPAKTADRVVATVGALVGAAVEAEAISPENTPGVADAAALAVELTQAQHHLSRSVARMREAKRLRDEAIERLERARDNACTVANRVEELKARLAGRELTGQVRVVSPLSVEVMLERAAEKYGMTLDEVDALWEENGRRLDEPELHDLWLMWGSSRTARTSGD